MAVYREFLGAEALRFALTPEPPTPTASTDPAPTDPVDASGDVDHTSQQPTGTGGGGDSSMKRTYAIRALLSVCSALTAIFLVSGANAKW